MITKFMAAGILLMTLQTGVVIGQQAYSLNSADGLELINVKAAATTHMGKAGIRVEGTAPAPAGERRAGGGEVRVESLAIVSGTQVTNGTIELELAGSPAGAVGGMARGFVGIAFRVHQNGDHYAYDCFYIRPTNGRAEDQLRRNHSCQYVHHPEWGWNRLRTESPGMYESYIDLEDGAWTRIKVTVNGTDASLYVHGAAQPCLIVKDLKSGTGGHGAVALWSEQTTIAYFRNLMITPR